MLNKYLSSLAIAAALGVFTAWMPVHVAQDGISVSYTAAHADGEKKKGDKEKGEKEKKDKKEKSKKDGDDKSCTKDKPCNDDNDNRKGKSVV